MNRKPSPDEKASQRASSVINNDSSCYGEEQALPLPAQKTSRHRLNKRWLLWGIGLMSGFAIQWSLKLPNFLMDKSFHRAASTPIQATNPLVVETIVAKPVDSYQESRSYTGTLVARRSSDLGFERAGQLQQILVDEGDRVRAGESLAYLDTSQLKAKRRELLAQRAQAMAQMQELKAGPRRETIRAAQAVVKNINEQLRLARLKNQRRETLYTQGAIAREQLEQTAFEASALQARLEEAQSQLKELQSGTRPEQIDAQQASVAQIDASIAQLDLEIEKSVIKAFFSGTIAARHVDEGRVIAVNQPILRLVESNHLEARVSLPVEDAQEIPISSVQQLSINNKLYQAKVTSILPEANASTGTVTVVLALAPETAAEMLPGQTVALLWSDTVSESGYWLPATALVRGQRGLWSCYILSESTAPASAKTFRVVKREIEVLHTDNASDQNQAVRVLVRGTLEEGDRVVSSGTHRLISGQIVRPSKPDDRV